MAQKELKRDDVVIMTAILDKTIIGYIYGSSEDRNWNALLDKHGAIHDIFVTKSARKTGAGKKLLQAMTEELTRRGAKRIVLSTMTDNKTAQSLFASCGFQPTMVEMTYSS